MRTSLFTVYGIAVGGLYAALVWLALPELPSVAQFCGLMLVLVGAAQGARLATTPDLSVAKGLALLPKVPYLLMKGALEGIVGLVLLLFMAPYSAAVDFCRERALLKRLRAQGRIARLDELQPKLEAGTGTLIVETNLRGPRRIWWTEADLFALGQPASTDAEINAILSGEQVHEFNARCLHDYLDTETGQALLTPLPPGQAATDRLASQFPKMRLARVARPRA